MIEQQGRVVAVSGDTASVRLGGMSGCAACDAGRGCGAGIFGRLLRRRPATLDIENRACASQGQAVMVGIPEGVFLRMAARFYLWPLLAGIAGAALGHLLSAAWFPGPVLTDLSALAAGLLCGGAVVLAIRKHPGEFPEEAIVHMLRIIEFD